MVLKTVLFIKQGRLVTFCTDNSLHLWEINVKPTGATVLEEVKSSAMENRCADWRGVFSCRDCSICW